MTMDEIIKLALFMMDRISDMIELMVRMDDTLRVMGICTDDVVLHGPEIVQQLLGEYQEAEYGK